MQLRSALFFAVAATAVLAGCSTRSVSGPSSPIVTARITIHPAPGAPVLKPDTEATIEVINARLKALGVGNFSLSAGQDISVEVDGGVDANKVQLAMHASGVVEFVPVAPGATDPFIGSLVSLAAERLWPGDEIASASVGPDANGHPAIKVVLTPAGAQIFGTWTTSHVGSTLLIVLDGRVVSLVSITAPIVGGAVTLTGFDAPLLPIDVLAAILDSGPLTPNWRQP